MTGRHFAAIAFAFLLASTAAAQEWTRFRGPNGTGASELSNLPVRWTDSDYRWKIELPGRGHSSPVLWGNKLFVTTAKDAEGLRILLCLNASDGSIFWKKEFPAETQKIHTQSSFASSTPTVDQDHVYLALATAERYSVFALDHDGNPIWQADIGPFVSQHGFGTSPIVYEDMIVINNDQDADSSLVALDRRTGQQRWKVPRQTAVVAYSTPCVYRPQGKPAQLIFNSQAHGISSINPGTGAVNWEYKAFDKRSVSSPVIVGDLIFGSCGSGGGGNYVVAVKPGEKPELAYKLDKMAPYVPTSVAYGKLLFLWGDNGVVSCVDAADGNVHWQKRIGGNFNGSPVRAGDKLIAISTDGEVVILKAGTEYEELGRHPLGETCRSTPAIANGRLYLRTQSHLHCLDAK